MLKTILDVVVVVILLIAIIVGARKGLFKSVWGLVTLAVFVGALFFTTVPVSKLLKDKANLDTKIAAAIESPIKKLKGMNTVIEYQDGLETADYEQLLKDAGVQQFFVKNYAPKVKDYVSDGQSIAFYQIAAKELSGIVLVAATGVALCILYGILLYAILFKLIKKLLTKLLKFSVIKPFDIVLGIVFQVALASCILLAIGGTLNTLKHTKFMTKVESAYSSTFAFKYIYGENPLQDLFDSKVNLGKFIK